MLVAFWRNLCKCTSTTSILRESHNRQGAKIIHQSSIINGLGSCKSIRTTHYQRYLFSSGAAVAQEKVLLPVRRLVARLPRLTVTVKDTLTVSCQPQIAPNASLCMNVRQSLGTAKSANMIRWTRLVVKSIVQQVLYTHYPSVLLFNTGYKKEKSSYALLKK